MSRSWVVYCTTDLVLDFRCRAILAGNPHYSLAVLWPHDWHLHSTIAVIVVWQYDDRHAAHVPDSAVRGPDD